MMKRFIEIDLLTVYPASCLVRGEHNEPKTVEFGGVLRGRISSAAIKRSLRLSDQFRDNLEGNFGVRTRQTGNEIFRELVGEFGRDAAVKAAMAIANVFGKFDDKQSADDKIGLTRQLYFVSEEEISKAKDVARRIAGGEEISEAKMLEIISPSVSAIDIALFGRFFAGRNERSLIAGVDVMNPFTVNPVVIGTDFYVAVDDRKREDDGGGGFMGHQGFLAGIFYGYWKVDLEQTLCNLNNNIDLLSKAVTALIRSLPVVSPVGKKASFGSSDSRASWMRVRSCDQAIGNMAAAFVKPVNGNDQLNDAIKRIEEYQDNIKIAFGSEFESKTMNILKCKDTECNSTLADLVSFAQNIIVDRG